MALYLAQLDRVQLRSAQAVLRDGRFGDFRRAHTAAPRTNAGSVNLTLTLTSH